MDINYLKKYEPIFGSWYITEKIGEGSFGHVYIIEKREMGVTYRSALKAITIPQNQSEKQSMLMDGMSKENVTQYYRGIVQDIANEYTLMAKLKGTSNIVSYEDHILKEHDDGIGWDILIRMELLTPLYKHISNTKMTKRDIIKLGIDMCNALELCEKNHIIHRDIKPENIFISPNGDYKLGDFGVARTMEESISGLSKKGTYLYMAPEVYRGEHYGSTVDIYSLGIVLYKLLNNNRTPFLPPYPEPITYTAKKEALEKRMTGEKIPKPQNGAELLDDIVLKACAYDPKDRYQSASEMKKALLSLMTEINNQKSASESLAERETKKAKFKFNNKMIIAAAAIVAIIIAAVVYAGIPKHIEDIEGLETENTVYIGETLSPEYKVLPENFSKGSIEFSVGDDSIISVDQDGNITGKKVGESTLVLSAKGYKETVVIKVVAKVTKITNVKSSITIEVGSSQKISPKLSPSKFADEKITYKIENEKYAEIDSNGKITAKKAGNTKLIISAGGCTKTVKIKVIKYVVPSNDIAPTTTPTTSPSPKPNPQPTTPTKQKETTGGNVKEDPDAETVPEEDW